MYARIHQLLVKLTEKFCFYSHPQHVCSESRSQSAISRCADDILRVTRLVLILPVAVLVDLTAQADEIAVYGEPLKQEYTVVGEQFTAFYRTKKTADSFSLICTAGQATPDPRREGWYQYKPVAGLKFELKAGLAVEAREKPIPMGFAVFTKEGKVLKVLKPEGVYKETLWDGNAFISWSENDSELRIRSEDGEQGYAYVDLLDGDGLFYSNRTHDTPEYFLKDCRRINEKSLPVYDWR